MVKSKLATVLLLFVAVPAAHGAILVHAVVPDSPADAAGIQSGDRILRFDGRKVANMDELQTIMTSHQPGDAVPLTVEREGQTMDLTLTFGERPGGGVSVGVSLAFEQEPGAEPPAGTVVCLAWIDKTYRIESLMEDLGLELSDTYEAMRACVEHDTRRMTSANAVKYCVNVFKVHCPGLDLITEIGEALVRQCEEDLEESLGLRLDQYKGWKTCAQHEVFDRYSKAGESSDAAACRASFLEHCGTNIDTALKTGEVSKAQRSFAACCSTDTLDPDRCGMIDDSFSRGPCNDRSVCVNRLTTEWIDCSALGG